MRPVCFTATFLTFGTLQYVLAFRPSSLMSFPQRFKGLPARDSVVQALGGRVTKRRRVSSSSAAVFKAHVKDEPHEDVAAPFAAGVKPSVDNLSTVDGKGDNDGYDGWTDLRVPPEELRPSASLTIGQCFTWRRAAPNCWVGVLGREVVAIRQTARTSLFRKLNIATKGDEEDVKPALRTVATGLGGSVESVPAASLTATLRDYFFLKEPLAPLYLSWSSGDPRMAAVAACIEGVRVVRQDPVECVFSFICSSNNNIPRITAMLGKLRRTYGELLFSAGEGGLAATGALGKITECEEWARMPLELHSFPTVDALAAHATEADLRAMGFGYRAKYIVESAKMMRDKGGEDWALGLRNKQRGDVREQLMALSGVGPKVADCVALFSLDQASAIPVDVHVWRIACRDYDPSLVDCKSLTPTVYARVGDLFRARFGQRAGWAQSLLFAAELPEFKGMLSPEMQRDMDEFRREERESKAASKASKAQVKEEKSSQSAKRKKRGERGGAVRSRGRATP